MSGGLGRAERVTRFGRQRAVAASAAAYFIAVAVHQPMHVDADATRVAMSLREAKQPRSREYEVLCSPRPSCLEQADARRGSSKRQCVDTAPHRCPTKGNKVDPGHGMLGLEQSGAAGRRRGHRPTGGS